MGSRQGPAGWPSSRSAHLVGTGLGAASLVSKPYDGISEALIAAAAATSPRSKASNMAAVSAAAQWVATPMTPAAPTAISGRVSESSPEYTSKSSGASDRSRAVSPGLPAASLTAVMLGSSWARSAMVSVAILRPVRTGMS